MIHFLIFGLISVSVMALIVMMLVLRLRPMMVSSTQSRDVHKYIFLIVEKTPKHFLEGIEVGKQPQVRSPWLTLQLDGTLDGTTDTSGIGLLWAVCLPTTSLRELKSLLKPLKSGYQKTA